MIWALVFIAGVDLALGRPVVRWMRRRGASLRGTLELTAAFAAAALVAWAGFRLLDLSLERHDALLWTYAAVAAGAIGFVACRRLGRVPTVELFVALVLFLEGALVLVLATAEGGLASAPFRALLVAPAALPIAGYFGASLGYLAGPGGRLLQPGYETMIARRFLLSKASPVISTVTTLSMIGVALGVWLVTMSLGVLGGFENDLKQKIIGATAHVVVQTPSAKPFVLEAGQAEALERTPGVTGVSPMVEGVVAITSASNYMAAFVFGISPDAATPVLGVLNKLTAGSLAPVAEELARPAARARTEGEDFPPPPALPHAVIGVELAKSLNVSVGDDVRLVSPLLETMSPVGPLPKSAGFRVAAVFDSKMYEYDAHYVFVSLPAARRFFELGEGEVTAVQVAVSDPDRAEDYAGAIVERLGGGFEALDWKRRNATLFSALKLERVVAFVVLVPIILVASFAIINTLTMSVVEKKKEIAILKTMGAHDGGILKLFLSQGLIVGSFGTVLGAVTGVAFVAALASFGFTIPGDVYYIDSLPVHLEWLDVAVVVLAALLIVWDCSVFPALRGARLSPVEGLRDA